MKHTIMKLKKEWENGEWTPEKGRLWEGAGVIITNRREDHSAAEPEYTFLVTDHAARYSSFFTRLYRACAGIHAVDYCSKYEFCDRVAKAARAAIAEHGDELAPMIDASFAEALKMAEEYDHILYFAYGSNMDERQMAYRCPNSRLLGAARLEGYRFGLDEAGVATVVPAPGEAVEGLLWDLCSSDACTLDRYEGVESRCYRREYLDVRCGEDAQTVLIYLSNRPLRDRQPRSGYMERIVTAAEDHGFTPAYVDRLKAMTK